MNASETSVDLQGLNRALGELAGVLKADARELVRVEAGQMAWRIAQNFGPKSYASARAKAAKDVSEHLFPTPKKIFIGPKVGEGKTAWLYAGQNFIAGVSKDDDLRQQNSAEATKSYYASRETNKGRRAAWKDFGKTKRGQHAMILQRKMVSRQTYATVVRSIQKNIGQAKASFAFTTSVTTSKRIPAWISQHFQTIVGRKAVLDESGLNGVSPTIAFGSRAKGVESNPKMAAAIRSGVASSVHVIRDKVLKLLNGYVYDFRTGATFKPKQQEFDRN